MSARMKISGNGKNLGESVFSRLQEEIFDGVYQEGCIISELGLSEKLGVSRTPIREAFRKLESEGLVEPVAGRGVAVTGLSKDDINHIYDIRIMIEGIAARWAAEYITDAQKKEIEDAVGLEEYYAKKGDESAMMTQDSRFHEIIFRACKSRHLMRTLNLFHNFLKQARRMILRNPRKAVLAINEHKMIMKAIVKGDSIAAEKLMVSHIKKSKKNFIEMMKD